MVLSHHHLAQCDVNLLFHLYEANKSKNAKRASTSPGDYRNKQFSIENECDIFNATFVLLCTRYLTQLASKATTF